MKNAEVLLYRQEGPGWMAGDAAGVATEAGARGVGLGCIPGTQFRKSRRELDRDLATNSDRKQVKIRPLCPEG